MIRLLTTADINSWLELAKEVEPLFGKMIGDIVFENGIRQAILEKNAYGFENEKKLIDGIIALSRTENEITWLAVSSKSQSKGIGGELLKKAINELDRTRDIVVQTFAENIKEGIPAIKLYFKYGFQYYKKAGKNPAGIETIIMKRPLGSNN